MYTGRLSGWDSWWHTGHMIPLSMNAWQHAGQQIFFIMFRRYWWKPFDHWTVANCCTASISQRGSDLIYLFISSGWICTCHICIEVIHYFDFGPFPVTLIKACCRPFGCTFPYLCHNLHVLEVMSCHCLCHLTVPGFGPVLRGSSWGFCYFFSL